MSGDLNSLQRTELRSAGFACTLLAVIATGCGTSLPPPPAQPVPAAQLAAAAAAAPTACRFAAGPIAIDGSLDDEAWQDAEEVGPFALPWLGKDARPARTATRAKLLWDREYLYIAADMEDGDLYADIEEHDGDTWENDVFEVFLKPAAEKPAYYEFHVTPKNTQFDVFLPRRGHVGRFKKDGEFGIESAVKLRGTLNDYTDRDDGWSVEMRIPWASLARTGGGPEPDDEWRFALCRYDFDVAHEWPELSTSAPLDGKNHPDFHAHERYAPIRFVNDDKAAAGPRQPSPR
jgi:hypothetical protein